MRPEDASKSAEERSAEQEVIKTNFGETMPVQQQTSAEARAQDSATRAAGWVGQTLGKYRVTSELGRGAMGVVLKAHDPMIERDVAIKVLADHLSADATALGRFLAEAKAAGKINHPNVAAIYEICQEGAMNYLVLEYVPGGSLEDRLTERCALPLLEATQTLIDACKGVGAAHAAGLIHRDIKPANFMRAADGSIKVADFGLAKSSDGRSREFTQTGTVVGTPFYMSPEQCEAKALDQRSDVYSLGATYYTLLTGQCPYHDSDSVPQLMYAHCHGPIPDPRSVNPAIPPACARIIAIAMAKAPADRYQTAAEMLADLQAVLAALSGQARIELPSDSATVAAHTAAHAGAAELKKCEVRSRRWLFALAAGILVAGAAVFAWLGWGENQQSIDNSADTTDAAASVLTATAPGVTAADITLGMSGPFSGAVKEVGRSMQIGIETYLQHVNKTAGGIHGRKLKLLALDDAYEPERTLATMKEMIEERPVFAFLGNVGTATTEAVLPLVLENKRVFFGAFTGTRILRRDPPDRYVFNYRASFGEETAAIVQYLLTIRGIKSDEIAVFAQMDRYGDAGFNGVARALRKAGFDDKRIVRVGYERHSMNLDAAISELLQHKDKIKAVVMVPTYRQAAAFIKRIKDGGIAPIFTSVSFVNSDALAEELKELGSKYAEGVIVTQVVPYFGSGSTGVLEYRERLARYFPAEHPGFVSLEGYIAARALCAGLEKAGPELTAEKLVDALEAIHDLDFGIGAKISFGPSTHQASHKVWAVIMDGQGKFRNLDLD